KFKMYNRDIESNLEKDYKNSLSKEESTYDEAILKRKELDLKLMMYKFFGIILIVIGAIWMIYSNIVMHNYLSSILWSSFQWITQGLYVGSGIIAIIGLIYRFFNEKIGNNINILGGFLPLTYVLFIIVFIIFTMGFVNLYEYFFLFLSFLMSGVFMGYLSQPIMILIGTILIHKAQEHI
ncbi:MAG: hypothetical protein ACFFCV_12815, partial [Promethearchaeota archaeon]